MGLRDDYRRHSKHVTRGPRWDALRQQALRRDGWKCVECRGTYRLEIDHIEPVRHRPDLSYEISNLQTLCSCCHTRKTRQEIGHPEAKPEVVEWRKLLKSRI